jgi:hypothetical protein
MVTMYPGSKMQLGKCIHIYNCALKFAVHCSNICIHAGKRMALSLRVCIPSSSEFLVTFFHSISSSFVVISDSRISLLSCDVENETARNSHGAKCT